MNYKCEFEAKAIQFVNTTENISELEELLDTNFLVVDNCILCVDDFTEANIGDWVVISNLDNTVSVYTNEIFNIYFKKID